MLLAFLLPSLVFAIFATIFADAAEGNLHAHIGLALDTEDPSLVEFAEILTADDDLQVTLVAGSSDQLRRYVRDGAFDAGLIVRGSVEVEAEPLFIIISEPSRRIAALVLEGIINQRLVEHLPGLLARRQTQAVEPLIGGFSTRQTARLERRLQAMSTEPGAEALPAERAELALIQTESAYRQRKAVPDYSGVAYYAGAISILFLLLSAVNVGMVSLEENRNGISDRLLLSPAAKLQLMFGRWLFLLVLGFLQVVIIFTVARVGFQLPVEQALPQVLAVALAAAAASSGLALFILSLCRTVQQANNFTSFFVLIVSAVGGSMVPRFMMPEWLQAVSLFTPNAWAIEGFYSALVRGGSWSQILVPCALLAALGLGCLLLAAVPRGRPM
ncbi:ABC transporter permease [Gilvimarinus sp. F26214L]|uniref:ABC transporter permease n=1 Tax=Gilvimarinus sp. DZF01 TaxID=3461371 RepID=UPI004045250A